MALTARHRRTREPRSRNPGRMVPPYGFSPEVVGLRGIAGASMLVSQNVDDGSVNIGDLGFDVQIYDAVYRTNIFLGSNGYLTFGFGSSVYSNLSLTNPGRGLLVKAADRSYQRVYTKADKPGKSYRVRYEGSGGTSGTPGSSGMLWEVTFFDDGTIQLVTGMLDMAHGDSSGINVLTDGGGVNSTDFTPIANSSFVFTRLSSTNYMVRTGSYWI